MPSLKLIISSAFAILLLIYSALGAGANRHQFDDQFNTILQSFKNKQFFKMQNKGKNLPKLHGVIAYRATDREHKLLAPRMYDSIEMLLVNQIPTSHATILECLECKVNKIEQYPHYISKTIRLNSTSELLDIAQKLNADHILVWGLMPGSNALLYLRFVNAYTGAIIWSKFIHDEF